MAALVDPAERERVLDLVRQHGFNATSFQTLEEGYRYFFFGEGCVAYVTHFPCINCAKILAAAGIAEIRYRNDYKNDPLVEPLLNESGVKVTRLATN